MEQEKNLRQEMYIFNTYEIACGPIYDSVRISADFGDKRIVVSFPNGEIFFKELDEKRKENLK